MVNNWIKDLLTLTDDEWSLFICNRDPFSDKIKTDEQIDYASKAISCGKNLACRLKHDFGNISVKELVKIMGLNLLYVDRQNNSGQMLFAYFEEPDSITIFSENAIATDALLSEQGLSHVVGDVKTSDLLIAHELYHYLEHKEHEIFTVQKHVKLWKLGIFEKKSRILCLEEIGAMAFAKELTGLYCSPYIFNVLMLYPHNQEKAQQLYESIMKFKRTRER